jgi:hypothetical protein
MNFSEVFVIFIPIVGTVAFFAWLIVKSIVRARVRELEIRERIAMIEKGLVPAPEVDPRGFDRAMARRDGTDEYEPYSGGYRYNRSALRHRRAGTTLVGVGLGLMLMIAFAGEDPQQGVGVGGFLVMLGLAFLVNGFLDRREPPNPEPGRAAASAVETPKTDNLQG